MATMLDIQIEAQARRQAMYWLGRRMRWESVLSRLRRDRRDEVLHRVA